MADVILVKLEPPGGGHQIAPPFGILYLASALEQAGFSTRLIHERGTRETITRIVGEIVRDTPILVGFSTLTGPSLAPTLDASRALRRASKVPIVWGGLHPTMLPEQSLSAGCVDIAVIGEGEETVVELAQVMKEGGSTGKSFQAIAGIAFPRDGHIVRTAARPFIRNLDRYAPAWHLLQIQDYFFHDRHFYSEMGSSLTAPVVASVITSRGCPWRCGYCYNQFVNRRSFRAHSAERIIDDLRRLRQDHGASAIIIEDDCFFADRSRGLEIVRHMDVPWNVSIRANDICRWGDEFIRTLASCNCQEIRIGAESGSQRILDLMGKDITVADIRKSVAICRSHGIRTGLNFMIGIPGETMDDIRQTFALMDELEAIGPGVAVNGPSIFLPWPGTALYDLAVKQGFVPPDSMEGWSNRWGPSQPKTPFLDKGYRLAGYYRFLAFRKDLHFLKFPLLTRCLRRLALWRWRHRFFHIPLDYYVPRFFLRLLRAMGFGRIGEALYE